MVSCGIPEDQAGRPSSSDIRRNVAMKKEWVKPEMKVITDTKIILECLYEVYQMDWLSDEVYSYRRGSRKVVIAD